MGKCGERSFPLLLLHHFTEVVTTAVWDINHNCWGLHKWDVFLPLHKRTHAIAALSASAKSPKNQNKPLFLFFLFLGCESKCASVQWHLGGGISPSLHFQSNAGKRSWPTSRLGRSLTPAAASVSSESSFFYKMRRCIVPTQRSVCGVAGRPWGNSAALSCCGWTSAPDAPWTETHTHMDTCTHGRKDKCSLAVEEIA